MAPSYAHRCSYCWAESNLSHHDGWTSIVLFVGVGARSRRFVKKACPKCRERLWAEASALFQEGKP